eukprot:366456-Chlamydomonas_euryale.AAC.15
MERGHTVLWALMAGRAAAASDAAPASPALTDARKDAVAVAKRLAVVRFWTSVANYARTIGAVGSLADLRAYHPFVCHCAGQLQANSPTPGSAQRLPSPGRAGGAGLSAP